MIKLFFICAQWIDVADLNFGQKQAKTGHRADWARAQSTLRNLAWALWRPPRMIPVEI